MKRKNLDRILNERAGLTGLQARSGFPPDGYTHRGLSYDRGGAQELLVQKTGYKVSIRHCNVVPAKTTVQVHPTIEYGARNEERLEGLRSALEKLGYEQEDEIAPEVNRGFGTFRASRTQTTESLKSLIDATGLEEKPFNPKNPSWKRKDYGVMVVGFVNDYGMKHTKIEPYPLTRQNKRTEQ